MAAPTCWRPTVSAPAWFDACWELFAAQASDYQAQVIGETDVRVAVDAGVRMGWDRFIGATGSSSAWKASGPARRPRCSTSTRHHREAVGGPGQG